MRKDTKQADALRAEIRQILAKVKDRDLLLFFLWTFKRISRNQSLPSDREIKPLRDAFLRVMGAIRNRTRAEAADLALVDKWITSDELLLMRERRNEHEPS